MPPRRKRMLSHGGETVSNSSSSGSPEAEDHVAAVADDEIEENPSKKIKAVHDDALLQEEVSQEEVAQEGVEQEGVEQEELVEDDDDPKMLLEEENEDYAEENKLSLEDNSFVVAAAAAVAAQAFAAGEVVDQVVDHDICQFALKDDPPPLDAKLDFYTTQKTAGQAVAASRWNRKFEELKAYEAEHGDIDIPARYSDNQALATWVCQQRDQYKLMNEGKPSQLTQERMDLLQEVRFDWTLRKVKKTQDEAEFQARLAELIAYKEEHGDLLVPNKYPTNMKLSAWIKQQKMQYKLFKEGNESESQLTAERVLILENVGFLWPLPTKLDKKWSYRLEELIKFKELHGHCRVPDKFPLNPQLATWVSTQRVQFRLFKEGKKASMITPARIEALDAIGFDWGREGCSDLVDWEVRYEELRQYKEEHGHCRVPRAYKENQQLGNWVHTQRKQYKLLMEKKPSMINDERVAALGRLGFSWSLRPTPDKVDWDFRLSELEEFKKEHDNLLVPRKYQKNPQLGTWVQTQREQYKLLKNGLPSHMTQERIEKLETIGGWVWVARDRVDWDVRLSELRKYKEEHGDCLVPYRYPDNPQLGGWVRTQREQYKLLREGKISHMTQDRINSLEELGFIWSLQEIWAQQENHLEKAIQLAAKKKLEESHVASDIITNAAAAIAASNPEVSDAATSAAVAAAAAVAHANLTEPRQEIANFAAVDATKTVSEEMADEEEETKKFAESVVSDSGLLDEDIAFV